MLFKPDVKDDAKTAGKRLARGIGRRIVSLTVTLLILGGLGYLAWNAFQQKPAGRGGPGARPDLPVPVLAASRRAFELSEQQLRAGTADIVTVLNTQLTLFQAEDSLSQAQLARLLAIVSLYQALGGGWEPRMERPADAL